MYSGVPGTSFVCFLLLCSRRGRAPKRQYRHSTTLSTRVGRRWQIVWQGLRLGFVAETGSYATIDALSTVLLLFASFPCFIYFLPLRSSCGTCLSMYLSLLRLASSMHCMQHSYVPLERARTCSCTLFLIFFHQLYYLISGLFVFHLFRIILIAKVA